MTYFVEGIQGSGKSTLVKLLSEKCPDHKVLEEGDYSPVELAWCAYMGMEDYRAALEKHTSLRPEIEAKTHFEDDHAVVCYTKIRTDDRNFYQAMEKYEIYNNRVSFERFKDIVLKRYGRWDGAPLITECALFQNIVEDMILFRDMPDEDIIDFYRDNNSPHAVRIGLEGEDGLVRHWTHRQDLELRICEELFWDRCTVLPSKLYGERDISKLFG